MALFDHPMTSMAGTIRFEDATSGTPISMEIKFENGDFQHDEMMAGYLEKEILQDRGIDYAVIETKEQRLGGTFTCDATDFGDATEKTVPDMVMKTGAWALGVSVLGANKPWALKCTLTIEQTAYGAGADSSIIFGKVLIGYAFAEGNPGKFTCKMIFFNPSATITRA